MLAPLKLVTSSISLQELFSELLKIIFEYKVQIAKRITQATHDSISVNGEQIKFLTEIRLN
jgi:hypothetical protein